MKRQYLYKNINAIQWQREVTNKIKLQINPGKEIDQLAYMYLEDTRNFK
jgi:hypothetical protein